MASLGLAVGSAGCSATDDDSGSVGQASSSRWQLPSDIRRIGSNVSIPYEGAPAWNPRRCGGKLLAGSSALGQHVRDKFSQVRSIGGYACRPNTANTSQMSVHGTGRALDIFIPLRGGRANHDVGDPVANWLVKNAADIGVQLVIWNRSVWMSNGRNERNYGGPHPHNDHIHVEITARAAKKLTPFFNRLEMEAGLIDEDAGITTTEPDVDAGDIPVPTADASAPADAATAAQDATTTPPATPPEPPEEEEEGHEHGEHRDYDEDLDSDPQPGETDSLGLGARDVSQSSDSSESVTTSSCAAAPGRQSSPVGFTLLGVALAATLVRRRRSR